VNGKTTKLLSLGLAIAFSQPIQAQQPSSQVDQAVRVIVTLCLAGGSVTVSRVNPQGQYEFQSTRGAFSIERRDAQGLVDGITSQLSGLAADQANRARECTRPYIDQILPLIKQARIDRQMDVFEIARNLNTTLNIGTCVRGPAQAGIYFGDMSQGDGSAISEQATYDRLNSVESVIRQKLQSLTGQSARLDLVRKVQFFRFVPGRSIPYFDATAISTTNSTVDALLRGNEQVIGSLGASVGTAAILYRYYTTITLLSQKAFEVGSPRAQQISIGAQQAQQCIGSVYPDITRRIQLLLSNIQCNAAVPGLSTNPPASQWDRFMGSIVACLKSGA
jgi:hypothetical protein